MQSPSQCFSMQNIKDNMYLKAYRICRRDGWRGGTMPCGHTGRTLMTYCGSMGGDHAADSPAGFTRRTCRRPRNAKQKTESTAGDRPKDFTPPLAAVIGRWICFALGVVCVVCGAFGIFVKHIEAPPSASAAWLGSAYMPTLRVTAFMCLCVGLLLVRHGWSSPDREQKRSADERRP